MRSGSMPESWTTRCSTAMRSGSGLLSQVANSGITVFDMHRRCHPFISFNFSGLFGCDMDRIVTEDSRFFAERIHPDDLPAVHRNGIECLRFMFAHRELIPDGKFLEEYRIGIAGRYVRVVEQFQVLEQDRRGNIWLTLSVLDLSPNQGPFDGVRCQLFDFRNGRDDWRSPPRTVVRSAFGARARDSAPHRPGPVEQGDRRRIVDQRPHGQHAPAAHSRQAACRQLDGGRSLRRRTGPARLMRTPCPDGREAIGRNIVVA